MKKSFERIVIALLLGTIVGCGQEGESPVAKQTAVSSVSTNNARAAKNPAPKQDMLVTVDGETLRLADVEAAADLRMALLAMRPRRMSAQTLQRVRAKLFRQAIPHYVQTQIYKKYAMSNGVSVDAKRRSEHELKVAATYGQASFAALKKKLTDEQSALLEKGLGDELLVEASKRKIAEVAAISVSDGQVQAQMDRMRRINAKAAATNALVYAQATNVWKKIIAKNLTFAEGVADCSEADDASDDGAWATVKISQLKDEVELAKLLRDMKSGDVTPPVEVDNGLCLVKVDKRYLENPNDTEDSYDLSRIYWRLPMFWEEVTKDEMRKEMLKMLRDEVISKKFNELVKKSKIVQHVKKPEPKPERAVK